MDCWEIRRILQFWLFDDNQLSEMHVPFSLPPQYCGRCEFYIESPSASSIFLFKFNYNWLDCGKSFNLEKSSALYGQFLFLVHSRSRFQTNATHKCVRLEKPMRWHCALCTAQYKLLYNDRRKKKTKYPFLFRIMFELWRDTISQTIWLVGRGTAKFRRRFPSTSRKLTK